MYDVRDIVGKTLRAARSIPAQALPEDAATVIRYFEPGEILGVVDSYLDVRPGRTSVYWMFRPENQAPFYVAHREGRFDLAYLRSQGIRTIEEKEAAAKPLLERLGGRLVRGVLGLGALYIAVKSIKK